MSPKDRINRCKHIIAAHWCIEQARNTKRRDLAFWFLRLAAANRKHASEPR